MLGCGQAYLGDVVERWAPPDLPARWRFAGPHFVGRRAEFDALEEAWTAVESGLQQVVFVGGEAGAGKSRFIAEAGRMLHAHGATVLLGACVAELGAPYQPFIDPLRALHAAAATEVAASLDLLTGATSQPDNVEVTNRQVLYDAVCEVLRAASRQHPLVLVLEDLHWAGKTSLGLLAHIAQHGGDMQLLCLASHRSAPPDRSDALVTTMTQLYRLDGVRRIDLTPLGAEDIAEYVIAETGAPVGRARAASSILRDQSGGNAFYLREVLRDVEAHGGLDGLDPLLAVTPQTVRDLYAGRLAELDEECRLLIEIAAVIGADFSVPVLAHVAGLEVPVVLAALDRAGAVGLVGNLANDSSSYAFDHVLGRQAILDLMQVSAVPRTHARIALTLEEGFANEPNRIQRIAHHYASARVLGHAPKAVQYLREAARLARDRLAHHEAGQAFARAANLAEGVADRDDLRLLAAESYRDAGAFALARDLDRAVVVGGSPVNRLRAAVAYEDASWRIGHLGFDAAELLTQALSGSNVPDIDTTRITAIASLGRALRYSGDAERGGLLVAKALGLARENGDPATLAHALECSIIAMPRPSTAGAAALLCAELVALGRAAHSPALVVHGATVLAMIGYLTGDPERHESARAETASAAAATGASFHLMQSGCYEWARAFASGDVGTADAISSRLMRLEDIGELGEMSERLSMQTFVLRREQMKLDQVRPLITGHEDVAAHWAPGLLALYCELGRRDGARRALTWLVEHDLEPFRASATWPATIAFVSEAVAWLDDRRCAAALRPVFAEFAGCNLAVGPLLAVFGSADRYLGLLDSVLGREGAEDLLRSAVAMDQRMGAPLFVGYDLAAIVDHLRRSGAPTRRIEAARREAVATASQLRTPRLRGRVGLDGPHSGPEGLTFRELEVLRLVAEGLSNRQLSERLFITENTVTNHVRSILQKTGVANRTMAARYAAEHGLLDVGP